MTALYTEHQFDLLVRCTNAELEEYACYELAFVDSYQQQPPAIV